MHIGGLQKMTLLDYPGRIACTVFLTGCNLRCPFCHNAALVLPEEAEPEEIPEEVLLDFLKKRKGKLDGVCITGGEPTMQRDLPELMQWIRDLGFLVKLDTNGTNPRMLEEVLKKGLADYVAMDIKSSPARYREACGGADVLETVQKSAALLMDSETDYEFRTTVFAPVHTPAEMADIGNWLRGAKRYYLQPFVDSGSLVGTGCRPLSETEIYALKDALMKDIPNTRIRGI